MTITSIPRDNLYIREPRKNACEEHPSAPLVYSKKGRNRTVAFR